MCVFFVLLLMLFLEYVIYFIYLSSICLCLFTDFVCLIVYYKHDLAWGVPLGVLLIIILMNLLCNHFLALYRLNCVLVVIFQCF